MVTYYLNYILRNEIVFYIENLEILETQVIFLKFCRLRSFFIINFFFIITPYFMELISYSSEKMWSYLLFMKYCGVIYSIIKKKNQGTLLKKFLKRNSC